MYGLSDYTLQTLQTLFEKYPHIQEVVLYGSRAMGTYKTGSDIDITLYTDDDFTHEDLLDLMGDFDESDMPYCIDVSIYNNLQNQDLKAHIQRNGKPLYSKSANP